MKAIIKGLLGCCLVIPLVSYSAITVQYGNQGWYEKDVNAEVSFKCNNQTFGDPIRGVKKNCFVDNKIIEEGKDYKATVKVHVKYGREGWTSKSFPEGTKVKCDNNTFSDSLKGAKKVCKIAGKEVAKEGQEFWTSQPKCSSIKVFYGKNGMYTNQSLSLGKEYTCDNGKFGDPLKGIKKECRINSANGAVIAQEGSKFKLNGGQCP